MPIFILGMPRSGTSLIEQILGSHSKVYPAGELQAFSKTLTQLGKGYVEYVMTLSGDLPRVTDSVKR